MTRLRRLKVLLALVSVTVFLCIAVPDSSRTLPSNPYPACSSFPGPSAGLPLPCPFSYTSTDPG